MNAWNIILTAAILAAVVSFFVSGVIHLMCLLIRRFSKAEVAVPVQAVSDQDVEVAIALAAVKAYIGN